MFNQLNVPCRLNSKESVADVIEEEDEDLVDDLDDDMVDQRVITRVDNDDFRTTTTSGESEDETCHHRPTPRLSSYQGGSSSRSTSKLVQLYQKRKLQQQRANEFSAEDVLRELTGSSSQPPTTKTQLLRHLSEQVKAGKKDIPQLSQMICDDICIHFSSLKISQKYHLLFVYTVRLHTSGTLTTKSLATL